MKERIDQLALSQRFDVFRRYPGIAVSGNALDQRPFALGQAGIVIRISLYGSPQSAIKFGLAASEDWGLDGRCCPEHCSGACLVAGPRQAPRALRQLFSEPGKARLTLCRRLESCIARGNYKVN
jgi:hypothetical protein